MAATLFCEPGNQLSTAPGCGGSVKLSCSSACGLPFEFSVPQWLALAARRVCWRGEVLVQATLFASCGISRPNFVPQFGARVFSWACEVVGVSWRPLSAWRIKADRCRPGSSPGHKDAAACIAVFQSEGNACDSRHKSFAHGGAAVSGRQEKGPHSAGLEEKAVVLKRTALGNQRGREEITALGSARNRCTDDAPGERRKTVESAG